uniref:Uncharacterized protein n=1 Tax=viral metagenome TaxID=1070528 RepID=A0A6M3J1H0_9ZZZZ
MAYQIHREIGTKGGTQMGVKLNYPYEGCFFDVEQQKYFFAKSGLSDYKLALWLKENYFKIEKDWKDIRSLLTEYKGVKE